MLIYSDNVNTPFSGAAEGYKSVYNRERSGIRTKTLKSGGQRPHKVKKVKKVKKRNKNKKKAAKTKSKKKISVKNSKFLKKLGFRVKKH